MRTSWGRRAGRHNKSGAAVQRWVRRTATILAVGLALLTGGPAADLLPPGRAHLPMSWLWSWLAAPPVWSAPGIPPTPQQPGGTAAGHGHYVDARDTKAGKGAGHAPGAGSGQLPPYAPNTATPPRTTTPATGDHFNAATSKRLPAQAGAREDVYQNADGSYTRRLYEDPINYRATDGSWKPIDTRLSAGTDGLLHQNANAFGLDLAPAADSATVAAVRLDANRSFAYRLAGAAAVRPVVDKSTATYPTVLRGTDLQLRATPTGVDETLVLHSADVATTWTFPLTLQGLTPRLESDGSVSLVDASGAVAGSIPHGYMTDSAVDPRSAETAESDAVTYALTTVDGQPALTVSVDGAWLHDPKRVFPVKVDPTFTALGTTGGTYAETTNPGNNSGKTVMKVGTSDGGSTVQAYSYLKFDQFAGTFANTRVTAAHLNLFDIWAWNCTSAHPFAVNPVTSSWSPAGVTSWSGRPSVGGSIVTGGANTQASSNTCANSGLDPTVGTWMTADLSGPTFDSWVRGGTNNGLAITASLSDSTQWKQFASRNTVNPPYLNVDYTPNAAPVVSAQYPPNNYAAPTLQPELIAQATDPDNWPGTGYNFDFKVYAASGGTVLADSGWIGSGDWKVPAGALSWNTSYFWSVTTRDGGPAYSDPNTTVRVVSTTVPQPLITAGLSQNTDGGLSPNIANYTTSAVDAQVATVGPALGLERDYNTRDPRYAQGLGAGWSSVLDAQVAESLDPTSGTVATVAVTYPEGEQVAFGRNADGTFTPPQGRYATLAKVAGGYALTDKDGTKYTFTQAGAAAGTYTLTSIANAAGLTELFTYAAGQLATITSASGRALHLTWSTPSGARAAHVATVATDPVAGSALTWTYGYTGDQLASVCPPGTTTACTTYTYTTGSQYPTAALDANPHSYWRLGESSGTVAKSGALANEGADNATYHNVTLGGTGPLPGSTGTSTQFNGSSSFVQLPPALVSTASYQSISLWFKTSTANGVLFSYQLDPVTNGTTNSNYTPGLYVGSDGKLVGEFWTGGGSPPVTSPNPVTDNHWHHVVLAGAGNTQTMYLDGTAVGSSAGTIVMLPQGATSEYLGAGYIGGLWPDEPHASATSNTGYAMYFTGSISDVAFYDRTLSAATVTQMYRTGTAVAPLLATAIQPSGRSLAQVTYDATSSTVTQLTDKNGGVWHLGSPTVAGSSQVYASAVRGSGPVDYWRFGETGGAPPGNEVRGVPAAYNAVTEGVTGAFGTGDDAAVGLNGTTSAVQTSGTALPANGQLAAELWFQTTGSGVLLSTQAAAVGSATCPCLPLLYVSGDGKLHGLAPSDTMTGPLVDFSGKCLDNSSQSTTNGNPIQIYDCNGTTAQQWSAYPDGTVRVQGKCLDNANNSAANNNKIQLWDCNGLPQQVWQVQAGGTLRNPSTGKCLDVPNAGTTNGVLMELYQCNGSPAQWLTKGIATTGAVNDGKWHHAVITADGTNQTLFLDGAVVGTANAPGLSLTPQPYLVAGAGATTAGWTGLTPNTTAYVPGSIDELAVYRHALTPNDVTSHYTAYKSSAGVAPMSTVAVTDPAGKTVNYSYDLLGGGRLISKVDGLGNRTSYGYDAGGFLRTVTDPDGDVTTTGHDIRGNVVSRTTCQNQAANACSTAYYTYYPDDTTLNPPPDPRNDKVVTSRDPRSAAATDNTYLTTTSYDTFGNVASVTTPVVAGYPSGRTTTSTWTDGTSVAAADTGFAPAGLLATTTTPGGAVQHNLYNHNGDLVQTTDAAGLVTRYVYDVLGRASSSTVVTNAASGGTVTGYTTTTGASSWVDGDTAVALTGDENHTQITLPFAANFYGTGYSSAWLSSNGVLSFTDHGADDASTALPNAATPNTAIYPFWADLVLDGSSAVLTKTVGTAPNRKFVVEWSNPYTFGNLSHRVDFEVVLAETGEITLNYRNIDPAQPIEQGTVATVGVENSSGTVATQYSFHTASLSDATAITFHPVVSGQLSMTTSYTYDPHGRLATVTSPATTDRVTGAVHTARKTATYDSDNNTLSVKVEDLTGGDASRTASATYNPHGLPDTSTDPAGAATTFGYDLYGNRTSVIDAAGKETDSAFDANSNLLTTTLKHYTGDPVNPSAATDLVLSSQAYDPAGRLASTTDAMGRTTTYTYTDDGLTATAVRTGFVLESDGYDAAGHLTSRTTNDGATTTTYAVDAAGRLTSSTVDPGGLARTTAYTYSADDYAATTTSSDPTGTLAVVDTARDPLGRATARTVHNGASSLTTTWTLDNRGLPMSMTDPKGNVTGYTYDELGHLVVTVEPTVNAETGGGTPLATSPVELTGYDTFGEPTSTSDANGNVETVGYDAAGRPTSDRLPTYTPPGSSTPITAVTGVHYTALGQVDTVTDPLNHQTTYRYDQLGDVATVTAPNTGVTHYTYDTDGEPLSMTDPTGGVSQATYDVLGRVKTATAVVRQPTPTVDTTTNSYVDTASGGGWLGTVTTPAGVATGYTYNRAGDRITMTDAAGHTTGYGYDGLGRPTSTVNPDSTKTVVGYDGAGRATSQTSYDATGTVLTTLNTGYDNNGNPTSTTDARGTTNTTSYDAADRPATVTTRTTSTATTTTSYGYDPAGNQTRYTDGRGHPFLTTYTSWNLPESQIEPSTTAFPALADRTFTTTYNADGQVAGTTSPGGVTTTNGYDAIGDLTSQTGAGAAATTARTFGYDLAGRPTSASAPGGTDTFGYNDRGQLLSATGPSGNSSFAYTADGLPASRTDAAGTTGYTYDTADRLKTLTDPLTGTTLTYAYNTLNQPSTVTYGTGGDLRTYGYDNLHRLTSDTLKAGSTTVASFAYGYNANNDLTSKTTTGVAGASTNTYGYDLADRLTSWTGGSTTTNYTYDSSGNRNSIGSRVLSYNERNELQGDGSTTYTYTARGTLASANAVNVTTDAFGQDITRGTQTYTYDSLGRVLSAPSQTLSYTGTANTVASDGTSKYSHDPADQPVAVQSGTSSLLALTDRHQDLVGEFAATGTALSGSSSFDPLGNVTATSAMKGNLGYQSGWTDSTAGTVNMASRWYTPNVGQFTSRDTDASDNRYAYANNDPLDQTDPTGHGPCLNNPNANNCDPDGYPIDPCLQDMSYSPGGDDGCGDSGGTSGIGQAPPGSDSQQQQTKKKPTTSNGGHGNNHGSHGKGKGNHSSGGGGDGLTHSTLAQLGIYPIIDAAPVNPSTGPVEVKLPTMPTGPTPTAPTPGCPTDPNCDSSPDSGGNSSPIDPAIVPAYMPCFLVCPASPSVTNQVCSLFPGFCSAVSGIDSWLNNFLNSIPGWLWDNRWNIVQFLVGALSAEACATEDVFGCIGWGFVFGALVGLAQCADGNKDLLDDPWQLIKKCRASMFWGGIDGAVGNGLFIWLRGLFPKGPGGGGPAGKVEDWLKGKAKGWLKGRGFSWPDWPWGGGKGGGGANPAPPRPPSMCGPTVPC